MDSKFITAFRSARACSVPLVVVRTPDPAATVSAILAALGINSVSPVPAINWDCIRGLLGLNEAARPALATMCGSKPAASFRNPAEVYAFLGALPDKTILFSHNAHRFLDPATVQAIQNARDILPAKGATLVLLCPQITLPTEIAQDVLVLDEPLPDSEEIRNIVASIYSDAQKQIVSLPSLTDSIISPAVKALSGLAAFPVAQSTAMSISPKGLNLDLLWDRKRMSIEQTPGLSVWKGDEKFENVKDCDNVIGFLKQYLPTVNGIVFIDEIEKAMAGAAGDTSGVSQEMHGTLLSYMQDTRSRGMLFIGHPGTGKSYVAKAAGRLAGIPTIRFDFSAMKHSHVGESNARLRAALNVVSAVCQGKALFIATTNDHNILSPELRRRFKQGSFFFDLPSAQGRSALWEIYSGVPNPGFDSTGWTGAEIESCSELARDMKVPLVNAKEYIVPVSKSAPERIQSLQSQADGRFISASYSGLYQKDRPEHKSTARKFNKLEN